jgi:aminoglycoside phosphotransferase
MTRGSREWFVRKAARDAAGSDRLRGQLAKQLAFHHAPCKSVRVPELLGHGEVDGRFYFDMEFVRGADGVSFLRRATYGEVVAVADRLCEYLRESSQRSPTHTGQTTLFEALYAKLCDVHRRTNVLDGETLVQLFVALERLRELSAELVPTACHGDLTLENLVVDGDGVLWLIDFLDAPFEHWWHDVTKLHQDLEGGWYLRSQPPIARCVLDYLSHRLIAATRDRASSYARVHAVLLACAFVRILPYARNDDELAFVKARIEHFARISNEEANRS